MRVLNSCASPRLCEIAQIDLRAPPLGDAALPMGGACVLLIERVARAPRCALRELCAQRLATTVKLQFWFLDPNKTPEVYDFRGRATSLPVGCAARGVSGTPQGRL